MQPMTTTQRFTATLLAATALALAACNQADTILTGRDQSTEERKDAAPPPPPSKPAPEGRATVEFGLSSPAGTVAQPEPYPAEPIVNTEQYPDAKANPVKVVADEPVSTFSIDVDTASYGVARSYINRGVLPPTDAVRVEEMVNYFDYDYTLPETKAQPFQPTVAVYETPWNKGTQIVHIGIKGYDIERAERPPTNLVFLLDVSGSMSDENKLPLVKRAMRLLVEQLTGDDRVSIVVYAGNAGTVLEPTSGASKREILSAIERLESGGSTAGGEGIRQAYALAESSFIKNGVNRVILATDGDFNVGITDPDALEDFVARKRDTGVYLTVLGFGAGNYNDVIMQNLAQAGNGNAAYIDTLSEARKVLVEEMSSTLFPIANDVKIQIEFNPARVAEYRLIGYETRMLERTDFSNDKVDAGDIGAGHTVTALYEIVPVGSDARLSDPLRYGGEPKPTEGAAARDQEIAHLRIRYKLPGETASKLIERTIANADVTVEFASLPDDLRFAAAVAGYGQILKASPYIKDFDLKDVIDIANGAKGEDPFGYRAEFVSLARLAETAQGLPTPEGSYDGN